MISILIIFIVSLIILDKFYSYKLDKTGIIKAVDEVYSNLNMIVTKLKQENFSSQLDDLFKLRLTGSVCDDFDLYQTGNKTILATCNDDSILNKGLQTTVTYIMEYIRSISITPELF